MQHVLLDTTVYRSDPRRVKAAFQALALSCSASVVRLHVPFVVQHEFLSSERWRVEERTRAAVREINSLQKHATSPAHRSQLESLRQSTELLGAQLLAEITESFMDWLQRTRAVLHAVDDSHGQRVLARYFSGGPPFRAPKSREDLPDAFVMALVEDLVSEGVALHVVTADAGLKAACSRCTNAVVYEDLDSLMASAGFREEGDFTYANVEVVAGLADELVPQVMGGLSRWLANVVTDEELPLRIMDAELSCRPSYVDTVFEVDVDEKGLGYFGHGEFIVPFQATVNMGVVYMLPRATYETLPPDMAAEITVVMEDRENYAATEERSAVVSGTLTFELDEALLKRVDASRGELRDAMLQARVRLDSAWVVEVLPQRN